MKSEKNQKFNLKQVSLKVPGKTFLAGEYAVLAGGSCLGLGTAPFFEISENSQGQLFHPESAAGRFNQLHHNIVNPYEVGGFGASTAEFIFSYLARSGSLTNIDEIYSAYLNIYAHNSELRPSGADLITQLMGNVCSIDLSEKKPKANSLDWNFTDFEFLIYSTGLKVKTHEHLATLDRRICEQLVLPSQEIVQTFQSYDSAALSENLQSWSEKLEQLGLTAPQVLELKTYLQSKVDHIFIKPCGALGADVILVFCAKDKKSYVQQQIDFLKITGLSFKADSSSLAAGPLVC